jgi:hypothetical protein
MEGTSCCRPATAEVLPSASPQHSDDKAPTLELGFAVRLLGPLSMMMRMGIRQSDRLATAVRALNVGQSAQCVQGWFGLDREHHRRLRLGACQSLHLGSASGF